MNLVTLCESAESDDGRLRVHAYEQTIIIDIHQTEGAANRIECKGHQGDVRCVAIAPDSRRIASGGDDTVVKIWSADTGAPLGDCTRHTKPINRIVFSPDSRFLLSGDQAGFTIIWDVTTSSAQANGPAHASTITSLAFSADGLIAASASEDGIIKIWETQSGKSLAVSAAANEEAPAAAEFALAFSPDSKLLASGGQDSLVRLWEVSTGRCLVSCQGHQSTVTTVVFSPDGELVASGSEDTTVKIWEVGTGRMASEIHEPRVGAVQQVRFASAGSLEIRRLPLQPKRFDISADGRVTADPSPPGVRFTLSSDSRVIGTPDTISSVAFSPNGLLVAAGSWNGSIRIWEIQTANYRKCSGHAAAVYCLAFSPDSRMLASASEDNAVKIWDTRDCACLGTLFYDGRVTVTFANEQPLRLIVVDRSGAARGYEVHYVV